MECSDWLGNQSGRKRAVDELLRGREFATRLMTVLPNPQEEKEAKDLVAKVLNSFSNTISELEGADSDEVSQFPARIRLGSPHADSQKSEDSGESSKCCSTLIEARRGCHKRRKTCESWTADSTTLVDDGYAWRKYGQKVILNAKYPRNYFRCTHKYDQRCQAAKHVQRIEEDPPMYRTTYYGHHTCKRTSLKDSQIFADLNDSGCPTILSFDNNNNLASNSPLFTASFPTMKPKQDKETVPLPNDLTPNHSSFADYVLSPDHLLPSFDRADVISGGVNSSCPTDTHGLDMNLMTGSIDLDDYVFQLVELG